MTPQVSHPPIPFPTEDERTRRRDRRAERAIRHARGRRTGRAFPRLYVAPETDDAPEAA